MCQLIHYWPRERASEGNDLNCYELLRHDRRARDLARYGTDGQSVNRLTTCKGTITKAEVM